MLMGDDINFLVLDEPTNHLDIASREWIEDAISGYSEALLFVSHDRYFIDKFATRIWELRDGRICDYRGSFAAFREYKARQAVFAQTARNDARREAPKKKDNQNPDRRIGKLEKEIERLENELSELQKQVEEFSSDYQKLIELEEKKEALNESLMEKYEAWEALQ